MKKAARSRKAMARPLDSRVEALKSSREPRWTELIGCDEDGLMSLWDTGNVLPVSAFERKGRWIEDGHYVIDWMGHAITVHCGNTTDGRVSVLFMCSRNMCLYLPRADVERMLLGKVIPDPKAKAEISRLLDEAIKAQHARAHAPHRQRGRI